MTMNVTKFLRILLVATMVASVAANEKRGLVRVRPITREQYEKILSLSDGKPVIPEGRLINSAVTGLAGLAAGFQLNKLLPSLFGTTQGQLLGGYPLCTINSDQSNGRQLAEPPYLNVEELTNSLSGPESVSADNALNCILVLDDGKDKPTTIVENQPATTTTRPETTTTEDALAIPKPPEYPPPIYPGYPPFYPYPPPFYYPQPYPPPYIQYPTTNRKTPNTSAQAVNSLRPEYLDEELPKADSDDYEDEVVYIEASKKSGY